MTWLAAGVALLVPALADARAGDVFVADRSAQAILKIPAGGGDATVLADSADGLNEPYGMTLGRDGSLFVADEDNGILRVNRTTGAVTPVAPPPGGDLTTDVVVAPNGKLLVTAFLGADIYRVDPKTGNDSLFFSGAGPLRVSSLAVTRSGAVFVSDETGGTVRRIARPDAPAVNKIGFLTNPDGLTLTPSEDKLYIGSFIDLDFWQLALAGGAKDFTLTFPPYSTALLPSGRLLAADSANSQIHRIDETGEVDDVFSDGAPINEPRDIVIEPKRCGGRFPTVVGTTGRDVLRGSRFGDVISTLGGPDVVKGLAGKDIVCGGTGRDRLLGGGGPDKLFGQGGPDVLRGGKGRDRCSGGAGKDNQRGC